MVTDYNKLIILKHKENKGKIEIISRMPVKTKDDLSIAYTPGVAAVCLEVAKDESKAKDYISSKNTVAVITDGSAVLGLGNIGPVAALPVMEGKAVLFKEFGGVEAYPIALDTQDTEEIIKTIKMIAPTFGGINLEDISAPRCFEIEKRLKAELNIPVFHDDQHGTAIVVLAGLINSLKITNKVKEDIKVVINGSGAAGVAIGKLLYLYGVKNIIICDSKGIICRHRQDLNESKLELLTFTNKDDLCGDVHSAIKGSDVFIGVSKGNLLTKEDMAHMINNPIIFAMANPIPEIMPDEAKASGARIIATGRSDFPNQINNVLVFPGLFKGVFEAGATDITDEMKLAAANALANIVKEPTEDKIIPAPFDKGIARVVADAVKSCVKK
jgi:malate dehydrogenase (oxaloacetate-decarboxylating)